MEDDPILTAGEDLPQLHVGRPKSHEFLPRADATWGDLTKSLNGP